MKAEALLLIAVPFALGLTTTVQVQIPDPGVTLVQGQTALVTTDTQNDFLSPEGVTWGLVGKSATKNNAVDNIENLFKHAKANDVLAVVSPHYYYPTIRPTMVGTLRAHLKR